MRSFVCRIAGLVLLTSAAPAARAHSISYASWLSPRVRIAPGDERCALARRRGAGHSDTRMVEKHYGHLAPTYIADTVRAAFDRMGLVHADNISTLMPAKVRVQAVEPWTR